MDTSKIIKHYTDGKSIGYIASATGLSEEEVLMMLRIFKSDSVEKLGNYYNDEIKKVIAKRDRNNVSRSKIAQELCLSVGFVGNACKKFGDNIKKKAKFPNQYTEIDNVNDLTKCPSCKSKTVNEINGYIDDHNTIGIYCLKCNKEYFRFMNGEKIYLLNYEFDEE